MITLDYTTNTGAAETSRAFAHGGARAGAGRPKGSRNATHKPDKKVHYTLTLAPAVVARAEALCKKRRCSRGALFAAALARL